MTPAERLLAAADLLDKRAREATSGPWELRFEQPIISIVGEILQRPHASAETTVFAGVDEDRADSGNLDESEINWVSERDARYIATMHPEVGKALAWLLRHHAETLGAWMLDGDRGVLPIADLILAGESQ